MLDFSSLKPFLEVVFFPKNVIFSLLFEVILKVSVSSSSGFQPASPLEGEAVTCVNLTNFTASPLRGEAERSSDEGGIDTNTEKKGTL